MFLCTNSMRKLANVTVQMSLSDTVDQSVNQAITQSKHIYIASYIAGKLEVHSGRLSVHVSNSNSNEWQGLFSPIGRECWLSPYARDLQCTVAAHHQQCSSCVLCLMGQYWVRVYSYSTRRTLLTSPRSTMRICTLSPTTLSMEKHVDTVCSKCFFWFRQLKRVRRSLDAESMKTLVHAFVTSRVDMVT